MIMQISVGKTSGIKDPLSFHHIIIFCRRNFTCRWNQYFSAQRTQWTSIRWGCLQLQILSTKEILQYDKSATEWNWFLELWRVTDQLGRIIPLKYSFKLPKRKVTIIHECIFPAVVKKERALLITFQVPIFHRQWKILQIFTSFPYEIAGITLFHIYFPIFHELCTIQKLWIWKQQWWCRVWFSSKSSENKWSKFTVLQQGLDGDDRIIAMTHGIDGSMFSKGMLRLQVKQKQFLQNYYNFHW